jgi:guanosine-3',5'-bis(diphosphate) 3'-pyrophosphohydrolase
MTLVSSEQPMKSTAEIGHGGLHEAEERHSLREQLDEIIHKVRRYNPRADVVQIEKSFERAAASHHGQRRKSGQPYLVHPLSVCSIIADLKLDVPSICAGLLHDCVEDTDLTLQDVARQFTDEVAFLVDGVTKLGRLPWNTREERQAENFRKMLVAMAKDIRVILIKLADRTDNMRTLEHMSEEGQERIARETMDIYAPLANRLGIYWLRAELEDLAFRFLHSNEYHRLVQELEASADLRDKYVSEVEGILRQLLDDNDMLCEVTGRQKNLWGIYQKMRSTQRSLDQIHDVVAFRIITSNIRDCYAALGLVHEKFTPVPGRFKDYVAMPKPNQYQSLHTSLIGPRGERVEVQIRTREMHRVCEEGIAAHWVYKEGRGCSLRTISRSLPGFDSSSSFSATCTTQPSSSMPSVSTSSTTRFTSSRHRETSRRFPRARPRSTLRFRFIPKSGCTAQAPA